MKMKYIFEVDTPPQQAICPPMQYFKPMEAVNQFVYLNEEMVLFSVSEWFIYIGSMNVIRVRKYECYQGKNVHQK